MKLYKQTDRVTYLDERGIIDNLLPLDVVCKSALYITGKPSAIRGNHFHKEDEHYCVCIEGKIRYEYKNGDNPTSFIDLEVGDMVYTPAGELHRFIFETDGVFLALATKGREQANYEEDTVREIF